MNIKKKTTGPLDKEQEISVIKINNNILQNDKNSLKYEVSRLEKEMQQKDKLIEELISKNDISGNLNSSEQYAYTLQKSKDLLLLDKVKKQYKDLQGILKVKEDELEKIKKNSKITKISELTEDTRVLSLELEKMKDINNHILTTNSSLIKQIHDQNEIIKSLKYKNLLEEENIKKLQLEMNHKEEKIKAIEANYDLYIKESLKNENDEFNNNKSVLKDNNKTYLEEIIKDRDYFRDLALTSKDKFKELSQEYENLIKKYEEIDPNSGKNLIQKHWGLLHLETQADIELLIVNAKTNRSSKEKNINDNLTRDEIENIGLLIQKMLENLNVSKSSLEDILFDAISFESESFSEELTKRLATILKM